MGTISTWPRLAATLLIAALTVALSAHAQPPLEFSVCSEVALTTTCDGDTNLPAGTTTWIYWDLNMNGPDGADTLVPICDQPPYPPRALTANSFPMQYLDEERWCAPEVISSCGDSLFTPSRLYLVVFTGQASYTSPIFTLPPGHSEAWITTWTCEVVLAAEAPAELPVTVELVTAYPNPANGSVTLRFSVATPGYVSLDLYDLLGRLQATAFNGYVTPGQHQTTFEASDLPSGTYLYRLTGLGDAGTGKLVVLK